MEAASKLGLHANRFPTEGGQFPTKKQYAEDLITPKGKPSTQIAKGTGLEKGYEMLGIHPRDDINPELKALMAKGKSYSETDIMPSDVDTSLAQFAGEKVTDRNEMKQNAQKFIDMYHQGKYDNLQLAIEDAERYNAGEKTNYETTTGEEPLSNTSGIEGQQAVLGKLPLIQMRVLEKKVKAPGIYGEPTEKEKRMYEKLKEMQKEEKVYKTPILTAAYGGRIDKPLMGRRRDI